MNKQLFNINFRDDEIEEYFKILSSNFPKFLMPYVQTNTMQRLADISYFCAMENGNPNVYKFKYPVSRLDHSISTALMIWNFTYSKEQTLAALFHDARTPAFSHVIDYMNEDYIEQESTELGLEFTLKQDEELLNLLKSDGIKLDKVCAYKEYSLVDNDRPKLCADRLDGIFLPSLVWSQSTSIEEIKSLYNNLLVKENEDGNLEFSFQDIHCADRIVELNDEINVLTNSDEDFLSMTSLAAIVKELINKGLFKYEDLFTLTDQNVFLILFKEMAVDKDLMKQYTQFKTFEGLSASGKPELKVRKIDPLILKIRYSSL